MARQIRVSLRAARQIRSAAAWWAANRPAAQGAIGRDLARALKLLAATPGIGAPVASKRAPEIRRLFLARIGYHVYYRRNATTLDVLAIWHASRERTPSV
jgi:plasmid stabilization system protein ParE